MKVLRKCLELMYESKPVHEQMTQTDLQSKVIQFFSQNPSPTDSQVHDLAEKLKVDPDELEQAIYALLGSLLKGVGKHKDVPIEKFNAEQMRMGEEVELEHTDNRALSREIAKDHLAEMPDNYYTELKKMEETHGKH